MSITDYNLAANLDFEISPTNIPNMDSHDIEANPDRVAFLIAITTTSETPDNWSAVLSLADDTPILVFDSTNKIVYMHIKNFGSLVQQALKVTNYSGAYLPLNVTEFTIQRP